MSDQSYQDLLLENQFLMRVLCHDLANGLSVILSASQQLLEADLTNHERVFGLARRLSKAANDQRDLLRMLSPFCDLLSNKSTMNCEAWSLDKAEQMVAQQGPGSRHVIPELVFDLVSVSQVEFLGEPLVFSNMVFAPLLQLLSRGKKENAPVSVSLNSLENAFQEFEFLLQPRPAAMQIVEVSYPSENQQQLGGLELLLANLCLAKMGGSLALIFANERLVGFRMKVQKVSAV